MRAEPTSQLRLLDLQALDTRADQLAHKRSSLPELAELAAIDQRAAVLRDEQVGVRTQLTDLEREVNRAEAEVRTARERLARDRGLLDSGAVASARQLSDLQHEVETLVRRVSDLEDAELDVMERVETIQADADRIAAELAELEEKRSVIAARHDAAVGQIDAEAGQVASDRSHVERDIPADLLALYARIRADQGGLAAAAVHRGRCEGCHLVLTPADISRIRNEPADELVRCEECRRILVRTPESGL